MRAVGRATALGLSPLAHGVVKAIRLDTLRALPGVALDLDQLDLRVLEHHLGDRERAFDAAPGRVAEAPSATPARISQTEQDDLAAAIAELEAEEQREQARMKR